MATGEIAEVDPATLDVGAVVTNSGRVSAAKMYEPHPPALPFTPVQLAALDEAITLASRTTGLDFSVYLGELGSDTRAKAEQLHAATERPSHAVLLAVSPGERVVEVVTGEESHRRLADRGAKLAVMSMVASFKEGDLAGGLVSGLRMLTDQAGHAPRS
ncbi:DUF5130 family protein [Actinosynnema sp. NPDC047251]|uniref:DUF5130 domain-containing protein n=1 Tax=Saccharothrix espanaensis (strain ATCC 51144 / DSM 44229 / JCM 9112 / NBRC 15066 / NRRL 15764) TaxID=1179773 RepID=K0JWV5_SACES|nr:DUF5130 family protein [Saccharothrix espanaensis]CCH28668.1 hypothetical protein BN6_13420 [Saccharothrix espanaensis DSM 44229]